ncbi:MAG: class I SAM-dependent methyltransferase [Candidatus Nealsonbacteria bacterium]
MTLKNNPKIKIVNACRSCGAKKLVPIFSLGKLYISNFIDSPKTITAKTPLELVLCRKCSLLQLKHTVSPEQLYYNYWYFSGINKSMKDELADIAMKAAQLADLAPGEFVLDVGSNDSTLLLSYIKKNLKLIGFEPAKNLMSRARTGNVKIINEFFNYDAWTKKFGKAKAKIITAIAMFYDLDDPNKFIADIVKCLDKKGVFIIQMSYLPLMLQQNAFDNICQEHLEYYSLTSLENLLKRHGLEIFDVILNDVNGGSFRIYIQHKGSRSISSRVLRLKNSEKKLNLFDKKVYDDFALRVNSLKERLRNFIKNEVEKGKKVYIYGASTKGNTLLQFYNLDYRLIGAAADRNPIKWGKKTVGTKIPIIAEKQARAERPDYFLILPWHFLKEFVQREQDFLRSGGKFIVPLPNFKIISQKDL